MAQHAKDKELTYESQRRRIEKLMENPEKIIELPDTSMTIHKKYEPPDFVRNVMGSSAGAGSEMEESAVIDELDAQFKAKMEESKRKAEERTMKKRLKREKKRSRMKQKKQEPSQGPGK